MPFRTHTISHIFRQKKSRRSTHTRELDATVTALGSGTLLLQVKVTELTTRGLDDANLVGPRVVPIQKNRQYVVRIFITLVSSDRIQCRIKRRGGIVGGKGIFFNVRVPAALQKRVSIQLFQW